MEIITADEDSLDTGKSKSGGLRRLPNAIEKEPLSERDIDFENITTIIGPKYVLKDISVIELPSLSPSQIQSLDENLGGIINHQVATKVLTQEEIIEIESRRLLRSGESRFNSEKARRKKIRLKRKKKMKGIRKFQIHHKSGQRLILFRSWKDWTTRLKLLSWWVEQSSLPTVVNDKIDVRLKPTIGQKAIKISSLRSLGKMSRTPFSIVNTTDRLDKGLPNRSQPTIWLQWGRAKPSIRDIRVDGVKMDYLFVDVIYKIGSRLNSVWSQWLTVLGGLLSFLAVFMLIF